MTDYKKSLIRLPWGGIRRRFAIFSSISIQAYIIILVFSVLLGSSIITTSLAVRHHAGDEGLIDIVYNQRALLQRATTWMILGGSTNTDLTTMIRTFDQNVSALKDGGTGVDSSGEIIQVTPQQAELLHGMLVEISNAWDAFRTGLEEITGLPANDPRRQELSISVQKQSHMLMEQLDELNDTLDGNQANDIRRLYFILFSHLGVSLPIIVWGLYIIRRKFITPLSNLQMAARRFGLGDLSFSIEALGDDELGQLTRIFKEMRSEIAADKNLLMSRIAEQTHELAIAFKFSQEIASQLDYDSLLENITVKARTLMRTEHSSLCLVSPEENSVEQVAISHGILSGSKPQQSLSVVPEVVEQGQIIDAQVTDLACQFLQSHSSGRCLSAPLRVGNRIIGALCVLRNPASSYGENEKRAFSLLANSAAVAIENARLIKENERRAREIAVFAERQRLAAELHDNLAQTLNTINLKIGQIQHLGGKSSNRTAQAGLEQVQTNVMTAIEQSRILISEMISPHNEQANELLTQLNLDVKKFMAATGIQVEIEGLDDSLNSDLSALAQKQLLMIINESFTNIKRHAEAENVIIHFCEDHGRLRLTIEDDGRGFDPEMVQGGHHLGMRIMRTRAERVGGTLSVISAPGEGTQITISFPIQKE